MTALAAPPVACPTCGRQHPGAVPVVALLDRPMRPTQRRMMELLVAAWPRAVTQAALIDAIWGSDPNGGPDDPRAVINVQVCRLRKILVAFGWTLSTSKGGDYGARRLVPITEGARP